MKEFIMDGYVQKDVQVRSTKSGKQVTQFALNSPTRVKDVNGQFSNESQYFDCIYWHNFDNDFRARFIQPGAKLVIKGRFQQHRWENNGKKFYKVEFVAEDIWSVGGQKNEAQQAPEYTPDVQAGLYDEDIPF
jgi:single stranded DNA-binding protein